MTNHPPPKQNAPPRTPNPPKAEPKDALADSVASGWHCCCAAMDG